MIPFSILFAVIESDEMSREISITELSLDSFSFRMAETIKYFTEIKKITLYFNNKKINQKYITVELSAEDFEIVQGEKTDFYVEYTVIVKKAENNSFHEAAGMLTEEYLDYISSRLELSDSELSEHLLGEYRAGADEIFFDNEGEYFNNWSELVRKKLNWTIKEEFELGILLDNNEALSDYLNSDGGILEFIKEYWSKNNLNFHPVSKIIPKHLYIGNSFCKCLLPDKELLNGAFEKAKADGLSVTVLIPPIDETGYEYLSSYIKLCSSQAEVIAGGVLSVKKRKDARAHYIDICEDCLDLLAGNNKAVFFPLYQMNTGTFCPLYAAVKNGDRGKQRRINECDRICGRKNFLYPVHLNMIGRYNSVFGYSLDSLITGKILQKHIDNHERLVINL